MKSKGVVGVIVAVIIAVVIALLLAGGAAFYFIALNKGGGTSQTTPRTASQLSPTNAPTNSPTVQAQPTYAEESTNIPAGWLTYTNDEYGFEISYPRTYQALDDENNLYGWPNGIVLFYAGGQSYDLAVEIWNSVSEYESKYSTQMDSIEVKTVGSKYLTLLNMNNVAEVDQIISTFKVI